LHSGGWDAGTRGPIGVLPIRVLRIGVGGGDGGQEWE
jgi:hypothetical protein